MNSIKRLGETFGLLLDQQNYGKVNVKVIGRGAVVACALDFTSEGRGFDAQSLPSCCFLKQDTSPHLHFLSTQGTGNILPGVTLRWTSIPSKGKLQYSQLLHAAETGVPASLARVRPYLCNRMVVYYKSASGID